MRRLADDYAAFANWNRCYNPVETEIKKGVHPCAI